MQDLFLTNTSPKKFLDYLKEAFNKCSSFKLSVSFIKKAGLILFLPELERALKRGAKGQIVTSSYQNFTDISSLETFSRLQNEYPESFSCHFDFDSFGEDGFHSKGYIFEYPDSFELIVGSSNITRFALLNNIEWDISLYDRNQFSSYQASLNEFDNLYSKTLPLTADIIKKYQLRLSYAVEKWDMDYISFFDSNVKKPNFMQKEALRELRRYRDMGYDKALIVAATGSGKTYLAAFDAQNCCAKKLLYIVHREAILEEARKKFIDVYGAKVSIGLFTGNKKELDADFIFATVSELSRHLETFSKKEFDYVVLDECHHSTADSYQKIINYFQPDFLLGLTATPNRMDNKDVLGIFNNNIPYELSIADALKNDLIVPFHYYGIRDDMVDYHLDKNDRAQMINQITSPENCRFIHEKIQEYLPQGKLKAIGFCRSVDHAIRMAQAMSEFGYCCQALTGLDSTGDRLKAFDNLENDSNPLEIIFTVDILNEGIDIKSVNTVLFLRPTESQTIFIQQLGRGLRKVEGKAYLTVLDFIGNNYQRSVQIALALSSLKPNAIIEKPMLYDLVKNNFFQLDLPIKIFLDEQSKEEILKYIEQTNFNRKDFLINDYKKYKEYLQIQNTYPKHMDYLNNNCAPDILRFIRSSMDGSKNKCYYNFLKKADTDSIPSFDEDEISFLEDLSEILPLVRPDDYSIISALLSEDKTEEELKDFIKKDFTFFKEEQFENALKFLQGQLFSLADQHSKPTYVTFADGKYHLNVNYNDTAFIDHLTDLVNYGLERYKNEFAGFTGLFKTYMPYSKSQVGMLLNSRRYIIPPKGTLINGEKGYLFVLLKKDASVSERLNYADKFLSPSVFQWESETGCTLSNMKGRNVLMMKQIDLFIRKVETEDGVTLPFIYVGKGHLTNPRETNNPGKTLLFDVVLDKPIDIQYRFDLLVPEQNHN